MLSRQGVSSNLFALLVLPFLGILQTSPFTFTFTFTHQTVPMDEGLQNGDSAEQLDSRFPFGSPCEMPRTACATADGALRLPACPAACANARMWLHPEKG